MEKEYLPFDADRMDSRKKVMKLEDLLTMSSGLGGREGARLVESLLVDFRPVYGLPDPRRYGLHVAIRVVKERGRSHRYSRC